MNINFVCALYFRELVRKQAAAIIPGKPSHTTSKEEYEELTQNAFYNLPPLTVGFPPETFRRLSSTVFQVSVHVYNL